MMFERYTDRARRALVIAQDEARDLGHARIGAGHLLLGLIGEDGGVAAVALKSLGTDLGEARRVMSRDAIHGVHTPDKPLPFTSRAEGVLKRAVAESLTLGHPYIATEHLLLALISDSEGTGNDPLVAIGINPDDARAKVMELLRGYEKSAKDEASPAPDTDPSAILDAYAERDRLVAIGYVREPQDVPRLIAAVRAALGHHQPRQLYGMVETTHGRPLCDHSPDYDGDAHFEADDGIWYCKDKPTLKVCASCADGPDGDTWAEWPCPTYKGIVGALTGEGNP